MSNDKAEKEKRLNEIDYWIDSYEDDIKFAEKEIERLCNEHDEITAALEADDEKR